MSWTSDLAHGLAEHLADAGVGIYRPSGVYRDDEVGIVIGAVPASPARVLVLTPYPLADDVDQADSLLGLQVRVRSASTDPRDAYSLVDAAFDVLQGASHLRLGDVEVHLVERTASVPMGQDDNRRYEHADTYQLTAHRPSQNRP